VKNFSSPFEINTGNDDDVVQVIYLNLDLICFVYLLWRQDTRRMYHFHIESDESDSKQVHGETFQQDMREA
jgi:hypothetical protein